MIVLSLRPLRNSYVKAKMSHQTTPNHKRDPVICPLSTSPNSMLLVDLQSTTKISPLSVLTSKLQFTLTTLKKKDHSQSKTKKLRSPLKTPKSNGNLPKRKFSHKPKLNLPHFHMLLTVSFRTKSVFTFLVVLHLKARHQEAYSDWTSTACNGQSQNKRGQLPKLGNKHHFHFTQRTTKITLCFMEAPIMKHTNYLATSTFTKLKLNTGSNVTIFPKILSNPGSLLLSALTKIKSTYLEGIILMRGIAKAISMICMRFSSTWPWKKADLMRVPLFEDSMRSFLSMSLLHTSSQKKGVHRR